MIEFNNLSQETPYSVFKEKYNESVQANQTNIEAMCIASYSLNQKEANARFVNLKFINDKEFIFFSNYNSPKSIDFNSHNQITALIYWNNINVQIRMKALIKKTNQEFSDAHFANRELTKNALAISSQQSVPVTSYKKVKENYESTLAKDTLITKRPDYWGGFSFTPHYFEFWEGHQSRLNKRISYTTNNSQWTKTFLQP